MTVWLFDNNEFRIEAFIIVCPSLTCWNTADPVFLLLFLEPIFILSRHLVFRHFTISPNNHTSPSRQQGFDEFMNLVLDDAEEVYIEKSGKETKARQDLGTFIIYSVSCGRVAGI